MKGGWNVKEGKGLVGALGLEVLTLKKFVPLKIDAYF